MPGVEEHIHTTRPCLAPHGKALLLPPLQRQSPSIVRLRGPDRVSSKKQAVKKAQIQNQCLEPAK